MQYYNFDPETGEYRGAHQARLDPLESRRQRQDVYLLPAHATFIAPPKAKAAKAALFRNGAWQLVPDLRGVTYWDAGGEHAIGALGESVPAGAATDPRPTVHHVLADGKWVLDLPGLRQATWRRLEEDLHRYIFETRDYPQPTQITLQALYGDPDSTPAMRAAIKQIFDWVKSVLSYYYDRKAKILSADDPEAVGWDFAKACDATAPGHTLADILQL